MAECLNKSLDNVTAPVTTLSAEAILEKTFDHIFMEVGVPTVCAFGLVGNVLNLMVLTREKIHCTLTKMEKSAHIGLIALAVSDFMFCFLALMFTILPLEGVYKDVSPVLYYHWLGPSFITIFIITSTWLIVVMAGERYLAVCHPFKARKIISLKRTRITISLVYTVCIMLSLPLFFENVITETRCFNNSFRYKIESRSEFGDEFVPIRRMIWAVLFDFLPSAALLYFNICLIWKIHKAKKIRREMAPGQSKDMVIYRHGRENTSTHTERDYTQLQSMVHNKSTVVTRHNGHSYNITTVKKVPGKPHFKCRFANAKLKKRHSESALNSVTATLVAVVVLFLVLVSPSEVLKFTYAKLNEGKVGPKYTSKMITYVTNFMQALNFSFNFVLYCAVNKSFRDTLASIFCFCSIRNFNDPATTRLHQSTDVHELS
ncbi:thyrotropin-releasing hormone receptor-like [Mizuhopecten yessoensis]|uniref:thyrotropin-releasing hormone receptor-like n=1 Tax=Mizuhopecten yessoensis TaxID=6573 RepID=UPI000B45DD18|nr:thyrotropin-releasing hormone receptor-like [Mizuhopecten yessoensis]